MKEKKPLVMVVFAFRPWPPEKNALALVFFWGCML